MTYARRTVAVLNGPRRADLSVPADLPVAELVPELLDLTDGGPADEGWALCRLGGRPLPAEATLAALGVRDGELLELVARSAPVALPVVGRVEDALAERAENAPRWSPADRSLLLGGTAATLVAGSAGLAALDGPPGQGLMAAGGAVAWLSVAAVLARRGHPALAAGLGTAALPLALAAGALAPDLPGGVLGLLAGAGTGLAAGAVGLLAAVPPRPAPAGAAVAAGAGVLAVPLVLCAGGAELLGAPLRAAAAGATLLWLVMLVAAPRLAVALSRLARAHPARRVSAPGPARVGPGAPAGPYAGRGRHAAGLFSADVEAATELAVRALTAVVTGAGVGLAGCWPLLAAGGPTDRGVLGASVLVAVTQARGYRFRPHLVPAVLTAGAGIGVLVGMAVAALPGPARPGALWLVAAGLAAAATSLRVTTVPPLLRRLLEWAEAAALATLVPLVAARFDTFAAVADLARRWGR